MSNLATITNNILADSGIDDINVVVTTGSYANPAWITSLAWTKITGAPANIVTGTGTAGQVAYWSSGSAITGESNLFWDATNDRLGVGINAPRTVLDVATGASNALGIGNVSDTISSGDLIGAISFLSRDGSVNSSGGVSNIRSYATTTYNTGAVSADLRFYVSNSLQNTSQDILFGTEAMRITSAGYLWLNGGISGFSGSEVSLQVPNSARIAGQLILHNSSNTVQQIGLSCIGASILEVDGSATFTSSITATSIIRSGGTSSQYLMADGSVSTLSNPITGTGTSGTLPKFTGSTTIGNSLFTDNGTNGAFGGENYSAGTGVRTFNINASLYPGLVFWANNVTTGSIFSYTFTGNLFLFADPTNIFPDTRIAFDIDGTERLAIFNNGNVSIGNSPTDAGFKLDVNGTGRFTSSVTAVNAVLGNTSNDTNSIQINGVNTTHTHIGTGFGATFISNNAFFNGSAYAFDDNTLPNSQITLSAGIISLSTGAANNDPTAKVTILNNGNVGIGTASPDNKLAVWGTNNGLDSSQGNINVYTTNASAINTGGSIGLGGYYNTSNNFIPFANITGKKENSTNDNAAGYLAFLTRNNATGTGERMRITSGGNVGIGTASPGHKIDVLGASGNITSDMANGTIINIDGGSITSTNFGVGIGFVRTGSQMAYIKAARENASDEAAYLAFATQTGAGAHPERMRITAGGITQLKPALGELALEIFNGATSTGAMIGDADNFLLGGQTGKGLVFTTNNLGQEKMRITVGGNVLIGTTSDNGARLQVNNGSQVGSRFFVTGTFAPIIFSGDGGTTLGGVNAFSGNVYLGRGTSTGTISDLTITSGGYLWVNGAISGFTGSEVQMQVNGQTRFGGDILLHNGSNLAQAIRLSCNGADSFFVQGATTIGSLAGSGNRIVVANSGGTLISAVIGSGLAFDGTTLTATGGSSGSISGSGTSGTVSLFTGTSSIGNSVITQSSGFIGIGITPQYLLHIPQNNDLFLSNLYLYGTANNPRLSSGATGGSMSLEGGGAAEGRIYLQGAASGENGFIQFFAGGSERSRITSTGNLLVGTTNADIGGSVTGVGISPAGKVLASNTLTDIYSAPFYGDRRGTNNSGPVFTLAMGGFWKADIGIIGTNDAANDSVITFNTISGNATRTERVRINSSGNMIIGTTSDNGSRLRVNGTIFSDSSITATSFFESSDATIKTLVQDNYQAKGIESVVAKLYIKNGKQELGYYAQDLENILPSAVNKGTDGLLNLSYREVHTAKIAALEKRITELESQLKNN